MESGVITTTLNIGGMTCVNCQNKIEARLRGTSGVKNVKVSFAKAAATVTYDSGVVSIEDIAGIIRKLGYEVPAEAGHKKESGAARAAGAVLIIVALYMLMQRLGVLQMFGNFRLAESGMGYGMIFIIGLITSVHCIAMCGGINLSQCIPSAAAAPEVGRLTAFRPAFLYNLGRIVSYTVIGGVVGGIGSVFSLSGGFKGAVQIIAGIFMLIMGINMLGIFPWMSRFVPRMPSFIASKIGEEKSRSKSPLYIGLLNGLMPCGPLQAMQLYALSTGSAVSGALSMLLFSLGTVPLMFGLGAVSSILSKKFTGKMMTAGAVLVAVLGLSMLSQGLSLSGFSSGVSRVSAESASGAGIAVENGVQIVNSTLSPRRYPDITVQVEIPVKWTIDAPEGSINGCNYVMFIPEYNIQHEFKPGENVIEFTPEKAGNFQYSCWMGMIRAGIAVVEDGAPIAATTDEDVPPDDKEWWNTGGGCCSVWVN